MEEGSSFDEAAIKARAEFNQMVEKFTPEQKAAVTQLQGWWQKWFMTAGHKRLGRIFNGR